MNSFSEKVSFIWGVVDLPFLVTRKFATLDLHPYAITNHETVYLFEELIRGSSEQSNETPSAQLEVAASLSVGEPWFGRGESHLEAQVARLGEYCQAVITYAVTGEPNAEEVA